MRSLLLTICLILVASAQAQSTAVLNVTARIAPAPCRFPEPCATADAELPGRLRVEDDAVYYAGTEPVVQERDGVRVILF